MKLNYEFKTNFLGHNETYNEDYWDTEDFDYEINAQDMKEVAIEMVMEDAECDRKMADRFVVGVLWNYELLDEYLQANEDFVKTYFEDDAKIAFEESRYE